MNEGGRPKRVWKIIEEVALGEKVFQKGKSGIGSSFSIAGKAV